MERIRAAHRDVAEAHRRLDEAVARARLDGSTWAEIGAALGMSRQAAFKRFGKPKNPTTGETMSARTTDHLPALTEKFFTLVAEGDEEAAMGMLHHRTRKELPWPTIIEVWASVVGEYGELEGCDNTFVTTPKSTEPEGNLLGRINGKLLGIAIGVTTLRLEAGEIMGRVAFDKDEAVVGVLFLPEGATDIAF
ncbi:hypothetical protein [Flaviflexus equikiangi]|uniref:DUF3887 domain-containing protein n=1 Tax=Flaviflexus equikiangi TaxID=2758573 RepID=A0ABS2TEY4_9ACTO|nr:hypothetical protein [Flaviflexus equikiangi]MBM9433219.1 hypothetical protein [Flaviflexus equikiangi]